MTQVINLTFDKKLTNLAGNRYGRDVYAEQLEKEVVPDKEIIAIIPSRIEDIAVSFIQGIYAVLSEKYGKKNAVKLLRLQTDNAEIMDKIENTIKFYDF